MKKSKLYNLLTIVLLIVTFCILTFTQVLQISWTDAYGNTGINRYTFIDSSVELLYQYGDTYYTFMIGSISFIVIAIVAIMINKNHLSESLIYSSAVLIGIVLCASNQNILDTQAILALTSIVLAVISCDISKKYRLEEIKSEKQYN